MNRKTLISLATFAVLGLIALVVLRQPEKGERAKDRPRPFPTVAAADIETIEVTKAGATTVIKNEGGKYKVTAPVAYAADEPIAKAAFEALGKFEVASLVTDQKAKHEEFQVDDKGGVHLVAKGKGGATLLDMMIGKAAGSGTMVRPAGKDEVWQANNLSRYTFDKNAADWRDKSITTYTATDAENIEVTDKDGRQDRAQEGRRQGRLRRQVGRRRVVGQGRQARQLCPGRHRVDAGDLEGERLRGRHQAGRRGAGAGAGDDRRRAQGRQARDGADRQQEGRRRDLREDARVPAGVRGQEVQRRTGREAPDRVPRQDDLRHRRHRGHRDRGRHGDNSFTVVKSGSEWKATKPAKLEVDPTKITPMAGAFKEWKGTSFADDQSPKANGLAKPKATVTAKGKAGVTCSAKIGDETKDKLSYHVLPGKGADVYLTPKWNVDRLLQKLDDLKKGGTPVAAGNPHGKK